MAILITGAAGFVALNIVEHLLAAGRDVVGLDRIMLPERAAETILPRVAETQGVRFAAARLGSVYGPWEYATGVRDTLSPMLQHALRGEEADGLVRLVDAPVLTRTVYNLGSGRLGSAELWCKALARRMGLSRRRAGPGEAGNVDSRTGFHRGPMAIGQIGRDTGYAPRFDFGPAEEEWLGWMGGGGAGYTRRRKA